MNLIESMVFNRLNKFRELPNRERFILPEDQGITFFIGVIDNCINFFQ
jgi:hypothetical protein